MTSIDDIPLECSSAGDLRDTRAMLSQLFEILDEDNSGTIDPFELLNGLRKYAAHKNSDLETRKCFNIIQEVDKNGDRVLTLREFCLFINRFSKELNVPVYDFVYFMVDLLAEKQTSGIALFSSKKQGIFDILLHNLRSEESTRSYTRAC
jgi:hypothetical protein